MHRIVRTVVPAVAVIGVLAAGCGGGSSATDGGGGGGALAVTGTDGLRFQPSDLRADAGTLTVELTAEEGVDHTFVVEGVDGDRPVVEVPAGGTATGTVQLEAGDYTVYCSVPGHRDAGMQATLAVS